MEVACDNVTILEACKVDLLSPNVDLVVQVQNCNFVILVPLYYL